MSHSNPTHGLLRMALELGKQLSALSSEVLLGKAVVKKSFNQHRRTLYFRHYMSALKVSEDVLTIARG